MADPFVIYISAGVMLLVALAFLAYVLKGNARPIPQDAFQWTASAIAVVLAVMAIVLAAVTYRVESGLMPVSTDGSPRIKSTEINAPAPDFAFRHVQSDDMGQLSDYQGDVIVVNFWATWCAPCLEELPALNRLQERYRHQGLTVLTVSDERREALLDFEEDLPLRTVSAYITDPGMMPQPFRRTLATRPTTYVIDREGVVRDFFLGSRTFPAFEQVVRPYLDAEGRNAVVDASMDR